MKKRLVIGVSGASGASLAFTLLRELKKHPEWESHLVISNNSNKTIELEEFKKTPELSILTDKVYDNNHIESAIASGTFKTQGMVVIPCSMKTLAGIANGYSDNLLLRAADVIIKERRRLILVPRETPLSYIHLNNMLLLSKIGVCIMPPMMTYYSHPKSIADMERHLIGKILSQFDIEIDKFSRWGEKD